MVTVRLSGPLQSKAGGKTVFEVEAANICQLLQQLGEQHPDLKPLLDKGVTVAIDGELFRDAWFQPIPAGSEVHLLPRMAGG